MKEMVTLREKFQLGDRGVISLVGAGGKTTLMFTLARELARLGEPVLTTTTTKIFMPSREQSANVIITPHPEKLIKKALEFSKRDAYLTAAEGYLAGQGKLTGFEPEAINQLWETGLFRWILVEADGAARKPLKAPALHEPVIPSCSGWLVAVAGLDAVGKPLDDQWIFRAGLYSQITGLPLGEPITEESVATVILDEQGLMKGGPPQAKRFVFLNKADDERLFKVGQRIRSIITKRTSGKLEKVIIGALESEPLLIE
ncbi:MAG: putative selenium-dependent hydroxylase accessory protein YqeC [Deltaproteobacteria bacterium]|nr:putative selenium-dependent hydroxylase accessory protein YqeC [Deltaproteobacteria bacterium]MBW2052467.1 putative selenium-dependent hydroxylase accessory protein YqeC [Deltaproteobacteria bacterium]MBW2141492.1 putative selenium-dependent hydroxylase accessory protein YqeC [Deltaproteobacteria bacterium]MBW2323574.1 putative selenium-dependent hydroxylase accessory protein YqeC [Deltaproteobacteria bacterium]